MSFQLIEKIIESDESIIEIGSDKASVMFVYRGNFDEDKVNNALEWSKMEIYADSPPTERYAYDVCGGTVHVVPKLNFRYMPLDIAERWAAELPAAIEIARELQEAIKPYLPPPRE